MPLQIDQGPTAIAGIDGGIGLDGVGNGDATRFGDAAVEGAHDALGRCLGDPQGVANRYNVLPHHELGGIAKLGDYHVRVGRNAHHGQVIGGTGADQLPLFGAPIGEHHGNTLCTAHHMVIGHDVPLCVNNDP